MFSVKGHARRAGSVRGEGEESWRSWWAGTGEVQVQVRVSRIRGFDLVSQRRIGHKRGR